MAERIFKESDGKKKRRKIGNDIKFYRKCIHSVERLNLRKTWKTLYFYFVFFFIVELLNSSGQTNRFVVPLRICIKELLTVCGRLFSFPPFHSHSGVVTCVFHSIVDRSFRFLVPVNFLRPGTINIRGKCERFISVCFCKGNNSCFCLCISFSLPPSVSIFVVFSSSLFSCSSYISLCHLAPIKRELLKSHCSICDVVYSVREFVTFLLTF